MKTTDQDFQIMMTQYFESNDRLMKGHFEDDRKAFEGIDQSFRQIIERLERRETLAVQNGEHFSAMGKELAIMNGTLAQLKPLLDDYNDTQAAKRKFMKYWKIAVQALIGAAGLIGAWYVLRDFLVSSFIRFTR